MNITVQLRNLRDNISELFKSRARDRDLMKSLISRLDGVSKDLETFKSLEIKVDSLKEDINNLRLNNDRVSDKVNEISKNAELYIPDIDTSDMIVSSKTRKLNSKKGASKSIKKLKSIKS